MYIVGIYCFHLNYEIKKEDLKGFINVIPASRKSVNAFYFRQIRLLCESLL